MYGINENCCEVKAPLSLRDISPKGETVLVF
jgi:hypothetical protein